jgi:hypothetical protein
MSLGPAVRLCDRDVPIEVTNPVSASHCVSPLKIHATTRRASRELQERARATNLLTDIG